MKLYCWSHHKTHPFTEGQVEKIVYAMTAQLMSVTEEELAEGLGYSEKRPPCPREALEIARDTEMAFEHVEQGIECRLAGA